MVCAFFHFIFFDFDWLPEPERLLGGAGIRFYALFLWVRGARIGLTTDIGIIERVLLLLRWTLIETNNLGLSDELGLAKLASP